MATALFNDIIFGPIQSRRLGTSLGINLLPTNRKLCSFNCVYCECGWTEKKGEKGILPTRKEVRLELQTQLEQMLAENHLPDVITFAGNGEPTMHPEFAGIIDDTIELRNKLAPQSKIAVLSNATRISNPGVFQALLKIEDNIQKLDSAIETTVNVMDCPIGTYSIADTIDRLVEFEGKVIIQTMLLKGEVNGVWFDNTTEEEMNALTQAIGKIKPAQVMLYSISRDTPADKLTKIGHQELEKLAQQIEKLGLDISVQVSG
ncbi:MAG: radical SAM protein [Mangrovibacterium sp.]